jgi:hypothetical protein
VVETVLRYLAFGEHAAKDNAEGWTPPDATQPIPGQEHGDEMSDNDLIALLMRPMCSFFPANETEWWPAICFP